MGEGDGSSPVVLGLLALSCLMGLVSIVTNFTASDVPACPAAVCPACPTCPDVDLATIADALAAPLDGIDAIMTMTETDHSPQSWAPLDLPEPWSGLEWSEISCASRFPTVWVAVLLSSASAKSRGLAQIHGAGHNGVFPHVVRQPQHQRMGGRLARRPAQDSVRYYA